MNNIESKIDNLFDEFEQSNLCKNYVSVKEKIKSNKDIMDLIKEIKRLQKIATNNKDDKVEEEIKQAYEKLNNYPIYQSFLSIKEQLEEELFNIKEPIEKYFENILKF